MSISDDVRGWLKFGGWVVALLIGGAVVWGQFRGGTEARVTRVETTVGEHETKIDALQDHAARSETDMKWMKKTVEDYDDKQQTVLNAIESLKKP